jgi:hypothetical protein
MGKVALHLPCREAAEVEVGVGETTVDTELGIVLHLVLLDRFAANGAGRPAPWSGESTTRSVSRQLAASDCVAGFLAHGALAVDPAGSARCQRAWRRHFHVSLSAVPLCRGDSSVHSNDLP